LKNILEWSNWYHILFKIIKGVYKP
jgi:hypothetical protein